MDKNKVTRTFSIGAICSRNNSSDDLYSARRHSSAGIRALLWATSSARSLGCSQGSDFQTSRENIFPHILTPDSIPQFTIPSLSVQTSVRSPDKDTEEAEAGSEDGFGSSGPEGEPPSLAGPPPSSSTSPQGLSVAPSDRRAERSVSDPLAHRRALPHREASRARSSYAEAEHCLDPASRAALSLPHLAKVTTPYGFVTLSQSPQMASEEALLCQAGLRRFNKDEATASGLSKAPGSSSHLPGDAKRRSDDSALSQNKGRQAKGEYKASPASPISTPASSSYTPRQPDGKCKRRFYEVIRKHFSCH